MLVERHCDIRSQTLCLWGVHDPWQTIRDGQRLSREDLDGKAVIVNFWNSWCLPCKQEHPNARLVRVENASHWIPHDTPEIFANEVAKFLEA